MKLIFNFGPNLNVKGYLTYAFVLVFALLCFHSNNVRPVFGADSKDEPRISLKAQNQPLGDVLKKISQDTGYKFKINGQWSRHPVNASIDNMPIIQGLKLILRGLNHAIIYESDNRVKILVYGKAESRQTDSSPTQSFTPQIQNYQQEPPPPTGPSTEEAQDSEVADDSSEEADSSESIEEKKEPSEDESSKKTENDTDEQTKQKNAAEETTPAESSQEQE